MKPKCEESLSHVAFKCKLRQYSEEHLLLFGMGAAKSYEQLVRRYPDVKVWPCSLNPG